MSIARASIVDVLGLDVATPPLMGLTRSISWEHARELSGDAKRTGGM